MEKKLVGFSVQNDIIKKFNHTVQRNYRTRKIREFLKTLGVDIIIQPSNAKNVSICPIRLERTEQEKINTIVINNAKRGFKINSSDVISYIMLQISTRPARKRDTMHTTFTLDTNMYKELISLLKGDVINLTFEEFVLNDYKKPDIEYIKSYKTDESKAIPILIDKNVIEALDKVKDHVINVTKKKVPRSGIIRDVIHQMIESLKNNDDEIIYLQEKIMNDIVSLKSLAGEESVQELFEEVKNIISNERVN
ncbi:hypothetical protein M4D76_16425 [Peribacillus frigoritolerans]|uniref:hypothetical protein n=1 Tax=Peribacillus frigoritolerans TaxID=450367 RepID=UPI0021A4A5A9|nr:hypothetical protein [Peribacillus frigoritolerans]MCT1389883.1 hypothetical protein [Peribacillus frigoritolerans]